MEIKIDSEKLTHTLALCMCKAYHKTKRDIKFYDYAQRERLDSVETMLYNLKVEINNAVKELSTVRENPWE